MTKARKLALFGLSAFAVSIGFLLLYYIGTYYWVTSTHFDRVKHFKFEKFVPVAESLIKRSPSIDYDFDKSREEFFLWKPVGFTPEHASEYGVIAYIYSGDCVIDLPVGWSDVLTKRKYLFVAAQHSGNNASFAKRAGLAVEETLQLLDLYKLDRRRVFAAGLSGGARSACYAAFYQPDLFGGTIQDCGCEFYDKVQSKYRTTDTDTQGKYYGAEIELKNVDLDSVKQRVKFALVTGANDFRRGNILDIYHFGFVPAGLKSRLWDIPTMGHQDCDGATLNAVLDYLESK